MSAYLYGFGDPCLPTRSTVAPSGSQWVHEIKHDGYRLIVRRTLAGIRIKTRRGYDWTERYPLIVAAAERLSAASFVLDGEGVILRADGTSDFDRLHSRRHDGEVHLLGFDLLELDGTEVGDVALNADGADELGDSLKAKARRSRELAAVMPAPEQSA
jgi:bifunctional non-homologous end joining protein LigD